MRTSELQSQIVTYTVKNSRHDLRRPYIGLSEMGDCDRVIYDRFVSGSPASISDKLTHCLAYELEAILIDRLKALSLYSPGVEINLHGGLAQGHTDGFVGRDLLEIKTVQRETWLPEPPHVPSRVYYQVQAYLHFLNRTHHTRYAHVLYLARDTGALRTIGVTYNPAAGAKIETRLGLLVQAIQTYTRPACSCGKCQ